MQRTGFIDPIEDVPMPDLEPWDEASEYNTPLNELDAQLHRAKFGTPEQSVESAIMVYQAAAAEMDAYRAVQAKAKELITDVMTETGNTDYRTAAGKAMVSKPSVSVRYDPKALDALCQSDPTLGEYLAPHRKVSERAGTLRIVAGK